MLFLTRKPRQKIVITVGAERIVVLVAGTRDGVVKLGVDAPKHYRISREEASPDERGT